MYRLTKDDDIIKVVDIGIKNTLCPFCGGELDISMGWPGRCIVDGSECGCGTPLVWEILEDNTVALCYYECERWCVDESCKYDDQTDEPGVYAVSCDNCGFYIDEDDMDREDGCLFDFLVGHIFGEYKAGFKLNRADAKASILPDGIEWPIIMEGKPLKVGDEVQFRDSAARGRIVRFTVNPVILDEDKCMAEHWLLDIGMWHRAR